MLPWEDTVLSDAGMKAHKQTATENAAIEPEIKSIERWTCVQYGCVQLYLSRKK